MVDDAMVSTPANAFAERNSHYDQTYFERTYQHQRYAADFDRLKFEKFVAPGDRVIDFGCGGGYILSLLDVGEKFGVEINETSAAAARNNGITVFGSLDEIEDGWADVIISHHALEHVDDPLGVMRQMLSKLRKGGKAVVITPDESFKMRYREDDPNFHLFTWSPSNLGNLMKRAGFVNISASPVHHRWPRYWWIIGPIVGQRVMNLICIAYGRMRTEISQVRAIGHKP